MPNLELNFQKEFEYNSSSKYLYALIHGYGSIPYLKDLFPNNKKINKKSKLNELKQVIFSENREESNVNNVDIYFPDITKETWVASTHNPNAIVKKILEDIDEICKKKKYEKIYIIGYSMGALLARKVYVCACGNNEEAPLEKEFTDFNKSTEWAHKVDRIILLAGINRGWSINHHLSLPISMLWTIGAGLGNFMMLFNKKPLIFQIRKGASFITQLRIQWIYMRRKATSGEKNVGQALTIQLLGTKDDFVSPEDNIDLVSGQDFVYLDVPFSNHSTVVEMAIPPQNNNEEITTNQKRGKVFLSALTKTQEVLKEDISAVIIDIESTAITHRFQEKDPNKITDVIFVIHGIRDEGYWTNRIAQKVIEQNRKLNENRIKNNKTQRHFAIETSRYGYFPILMFALPWTRRAKVAWFMDQYVENLARYKEAKFSFIGHSNGTYLIAQAIKEYECCQFKRVIFAGSVVPKDYPWSDYIKEKRIEKVLNYVATFDWVVAIFPNLLHWFQKDLGSAGYHGFDESQVTNIKYIKGQHGAALSQYNWDEMAKFIVEDSPNLPTLEELQPQEIFKSTRGECGEGEIFLKIFLEKCLEIVGIFPGLAWIIIILIISGIGALIFPLSLHWGEWLRTVVFMLYLGLIWTVLTRI